MLKIVPATVETEAATRVKRSTTVSTMAAAGTAPAAAVKFVTCRATVWPGTMTVASWLPGKVEAGGTVKPLLSTRKEFTGLVSVTCTGAPRLRLAPMRLPADARKVSFVTIWNCEEEDGVEVTMPSIQSELVGAMGSNSRRVKVPSELRAVSMLATCPTVGGQAVPGVMTQFGIASEDESAAAVIDPCVEVWTVTEVVEAAVTTPVTSSTKSNCPVARLDAVGGSVEAVNTFAAVRSTFETTWG